MKTHIIKTPTAELLILEWQDDYEIVGKALFANSKQNGVLTNLMILEDYALLGKPDEIIEADAELFVDNWKGLYIDYTTDEPEFYTAKESLLSLIETEIHWDVNPFEKPEYDEDYQEEWYEGQYKSLLFEWNQAEKKTFDRNRTLIFKKG